MGVSVFRQGDFKIAPATVPKAPALSGGPPELLNLSGIPFD